MYKLLFLSCCIAIAIGATSQSRQQVDSLLKAIDKETADTTRLKLYHKIGNYYMDNNPGKAVDYFEKAQEIAKTLNRPLTVANDFYDIAFCYRLKSDYKKSLINYQQAANIYEQLKDTKRLSNALISIGIVYSETKDFKKSDDYFNQAEVLITGLKDSMQLMAIFNSRGTINDAQKRYDTAMYFLQKAYAFALSLNNEDGITQGLSNIGLTYKHQLKTAKALRYFDTTLALLQKDNAPADVMGALYNNIAATQSQAGNYEKASAAFATSIMYCRQSNNPYIEMENYRNMADMYGQMKSFQQQASYQKKYYDIKDSLFTNDNKNQLTELETDYQLGKKNIEIVKKDVEVTRQKSQRNISIIIALATVLVLAALAFFYSKIKKSNTLLQDKNELISQQKNELQTLNQVKDRLFSIISHDLRNPLNTLHSYLKLADNETIAVEKRELFKVQTMMAVINTSDMLDNLLAWANVQIKNTQPTIIPVSITDCVHDAVSHVQSQAIQKQLSIHQQINVAVALSDYGILSIALRNLLTNAIKFSAVNKPIYVTSTNNNGKVAITVRDEGIGLTEQQIAEILNSQNNSTNGTQGEKGSGLGLFLVMELLQKINAILQIESEPDNGSSFTILLPVM